MFLDVQLLGKKKKTDYNNVYKPYPSGYGSYTNRCAQAEKTNQMKKVLLIFGILIVILMGAYFVWRYDYYKEYNSIVKEFENIKDVKQVEVGVGNYDLTIEEIYASVVFTDNTEIDFSSSILYPSSFIDTSSVQIDRFDNWKFETHTYRKSGMDSYSCNSTINFGRYGEMNKYVDYKINNITDVIEYRNRISELVAQIPEYPKMMMINFDKEYSRKYQKFITKYPKDRNVEWVYNKYKDKSDSLERMAITIN